MLGLLSFVWLVSLRPDLIDFFGADGLIGERQWGRYQLSFLRFTQAEGAIWSVWAISLMGSISLLLGRGVRLGAPLVAYGHVSFVALSRITVNGGDRMLRNFLVLYALYAICTPSRWLDVHLLGEVDATEPYPTGPVWGLRLIQLQMLLAYPFGVYGKLQGSQWLEGTAALQPLNLVRLTRFPVPDLLQESLFVGGILTYGTLALESTLPILVYHPRTRRWAIAAGVLMHLGFDYALRLGLFSWVMFAGYLALLTPGEVERALGPLRRVSALSPFGHRGVHTGREVEVGLEVERDRSR